MSFLPYRDWTPGSDIEVVPLSERQIVEGPPPMPGDPYYDPEITRRTIYITSFKTDEEMFNHLSQWYSEEELAPTRRALAEFRQAGNH